LAQLRDARLRYEQSQPERQKREAGKTSKAGQLAIAVVKPADPKAGPESAVYAVIETNPDGKLGGVFICSNLQMLRHFLALAKRDSGRQWKVVIRPSGTSHEHQAGEHAFGAAQAAGFEGVDSGADPAEAATSAELDRLGWKYPSWKGATGSSKPGK
jgi:hypothetical protein